MGSTFIFDLDGTILNTAPMSIYTMRMALATLGDRHGIRIPHRTDEDLVKTIGCTNEEFGKMMLPDEFAQYRDELVDLLMHFESDYIAEGKVRLFPGIEDVLKDIRAKGCRLFLASNCDVSYMDEVLSAFGLREFFDHPYCIGMFPEAQVKGEVVAHILREHRVDPASAFMVGDRFSDVEAGKSNGIKTIGCLYGTGSKDELSAADYKVHSVADLHDLVLRLS